MPPFPDVRPVKPRFQRARTGRSATWDPGTIHTSQEMQNILAQENSSDDSPAETVAAAAAITTSLVAQVVAATAARNAATLAALNTASGDGTAAALPAGNVAATGGPTGTPWKGGTQAGQKQFGGLAPNAYQGKMDVASAFGISPGRIGGLASRPYTSDHTTGHAIDVPATGSKGTTIADWFIQRSGVYGVKYIIFSYRIWYNGRGWKTYTPPGAVQSFASDAGHTRHVHVSFY